MNGATLKITRDRQQTANGDLLVVEVDGDLDMATADRFAAGLEADGEAEIRAVVVDLTSVAFIDSSGIRELLRADRDLGEAGYRCGVVVVEGSAVARALELSGVIPTVTTFPTRDQAVDELAG